VTMPTEVVIDSSVIAALVTPEEHSDWASKQLLKYDYFHILDLNYYEVANAIRHKKTDKFDAKDAINAFTKAVELMNLYAVHNFSEVINNAIAQALDLNITVYDAAFVSLAEKLDMQLLTLDGKLANKLEGTKYYALLENPNKKTSQI
jgi:predicted nucleic acid-binding protein